MVLTSHEALDRTCPFPEVSVKCLGSKCMAWSWFYNPYADKGERKGYCGKVGM